MTAPATTFEEACHDAVNGLRAALVELYDSVSADPHSPQDVARRFGLNKTMTWNVSRLLQANDGMAAMTHIPGKAAIEKMLKATQRHGASDPAIARVRAATEAFEQVVEVHLGDRATLDLVLDGIVTPTSDGLERSRKLAFRGNSGLYGVQAKTKLISSFLAPNEHDPSRLDMAMISGYSGFRRLRSSARWPLFTPRAWASEDEPIEGGWRPIEDAGSDVVDPSLLRDFSQGSMPAMEVVESPDGMNVMLKPGPIGNPGAFDCYRADYMESAASRYCSVEDDFGEFGASITTPVEYLVLDIIVHEELSFALDTELLVFGRLFAQGEHGVYSDPNVLPIRQRAAELPGRPPAVATTLVPRYSDMVALVYESRAWDPKRFRAVRLQMSYPPFGATVLLRFPLPEAPAS